MFYKTLAATPRPLSSQPLIALPVLLALLSLLPTAKAESLNNGEMAGLFIGVFAGIFICLCCCCPGKNNKTSPGSPPHSSSTV